MSFKASTNWKKKGKGRRCTTLVRNLLIAFLIILVFQNISRENLITLDSNLDNRFQFWWKRLEFSFFPAVNNFSEYRNNTAVVHDVPMVPNSSLNSVIHSLNKDDRHIDLSVTDYQISKLGNFSYPSISPARPPRVLQAKLGRKRPIPHKKPTQKPKPRPVKRTRKPRGPDDWMYDGVLNLEEEWGYPAPAGGRGFTNSSLYNLTHIQILPTEKIPIKKDRRVILSLDSSYDYHTNTRPAPTFLVGQPQELLAATQSLQGHPFFHMPKWLNSSSLEDVLVYLKERPQCSRSPIFLGMATVGEELYWQLIENYFYTLVKYQYSDCALLICVSDVQCLHKCSLSSFPCFDYRQVQHTLPSVMEQIGVVKLLHIPRAIARGVDIFMLDLDVGFLANPRYMIEAFYSTPVVDIFVQQDYIFVMNRSIAGWKTWHTEPLPNIGMFLCRGNNRTAKMFAISWNKYLKMPQVNEHGVDEKSMPGRDQNHVLDAMRIGRGTFGLKYAYFSNSTAPLLDKLVYFHGTVHELGGELMEDFLRRERAVAMHTTCYEKSTKVMGLKYTNSFWNPRYYDHLRPTLTKQILYINGQQLVDEVRALAWLAMHTNRSLIIPNLLGDERINTLAKYRNQSLWPGFRVAFLNRLKDGTQLKVQILEPSFYWRLGRDYDPPPAAHVLYFGGGGAESLLSIRQRLLSLDPLRYPRVILQPKLQPPQGAHAAKKLWLRAREQELFAWANHSIGVFAVNYTTMLQQKRFQPLPSLKTLRKAGRDRLADDAVMGIRNCMRIFAPPKGNRTCFQICD